MYLFRDGDKKRGSPKRYLIKVKLPELETRMRSTLHPSVPDYRRTRQSQRASLGEAFIQSAWSQPKKLSPRIFGFYPESRKITTTVQFRYIDPIFTRGIFQKVAPRPVSLESLDKTILSREIVVSTLYANDSRGSTIKDILENRTVKKAFHEANIQIIFHMSDICRHMGHCLDTSQALVKMYVRTRVLTDILYGIEACTGVIWEWINENTILLIPGEKYGKFADVYIQKNTRR